MLVRRINGKAEMQICIDMYSAMHDNNLIPADKDKALQCMMNHVKQYQFMRVIEEDGEIIAWIMGAVIEREFVKDPYMQQLYYCSNQTGVKSYKCVKLLHEALIQEGIRRKVSYVLSTGSHVDTSNVFTRILAKLGWRVCGYLAVWQVRDTSAGQAIR